MGTTYRIPALLLDLGENITVMYQNTAADGDTDHFGMIKCVQISGSNDFYGLLICTLDRLLLVQAHRVAQNTRLLMAISQCDRYNPRMLSMQCLLAIFHPWATPTS